MNRCIDAGREGCPCRLAESGHCLICSKLSGGSCDDCSWQGTCIYTLYRQNGYRVIDERPERLMEMKEIRRYSSELSVFILRADKGFCQRAAAVGAYVFVKGEMDKDWYGVPISVLKSEPEKELIHLGVCVCGPKTSRVLEQKQHLSIRGVYYNGLSGQKSLAENPAKTYIFGKGIAMAPLRNYLDGGSRYTRYLNNMHFYVDLEKVGMDFFKDYFGDLPAAAIEIRSFIKEGICSVDDLNLLEKACQAAESKENNINVFALTSPYYAQQIQQAAGEHAALVKPTEGNFCCGEGICGACTYSDEKGNTIRRCKFAE